MGNSQNVCRFFFSPLIPSSAFSKNPGTRGDKAKTFVSWRMKLLRSLHERDTEAHHTSQRARRDSARCAVPPLCQGSLRRMASFLLSLCLFVCPSLLPEKVIPERGSPRQKQNKTRPNFCLKHKERKKEMAEESSRPSSNLRTVRPSVCRACLAPRRQTAALEETMGLCALACPSS